MSRGICCSRDSVALPREKKDNAAIGGCGVKKTHFTRGVVVGKGYVNSRGRLDDRLVRWVVKTEKGISEWTSRVDDTLYS